MYQNKLSYNFLHTAVHVVIYLVVDSIINPFNNWHQKNLFFIYFFIFFAKKKDKKQELQLYNYVLSMTNLCLSVDSIANCNIHVGKLQLYVQLYMYTLSL